MVAVFTGNALGLFDTSFGVTGGGLSGGAGRDRHGVNAATGNLVLQGLDELLTYRGLSVGASRTYNSAGVTGAGPDGWLGVEAKVTVDGTPNQPGSSVTHLAADGSEVVYLWNAARGLYETTAGNGAHDTFQWSAAEQHWIREDGNALRREHYEARPNSAEYRLFQVRDTKHDAADMARVQYLYDDLVTDRVVEIRTVRSGDADAGNDAIVFGYDGNGRLVSVSTRENGSLRQQANYGYDGLGRLAWVEYDLTPTVDIDDSWDGAVAANNDHRLYRTSYTYDGTSMRIAAVTGSDGQQTSYTYHADGKVKTVTRPGGDTLTFTYASGSTDIVDAGGRKTTYLFDAAGRLAAVHGPARDTIRDVVAYTYDQDTGDVLAVETSRGSVVLSRKDYTYDVRGNVLWEWDALGNAEQRTWTATNQLLTHRAYTGLDADGPGSASTPTGVLLTRYVYADGDRLLRFIVGPSGQVTEMRYGTAAGSGALGQPTETRSYHGATYADTIDRALLEGWVADKYADSSLTALAYDGLGRLVRRSEYADVAADGSGIDNAGAAFTTFLYDAQGLLLKQATLHGAGHPANGGTGAGNEVIDYVYDGVGRLLDVIRHDGGTTYVRGTTNPDSLNVGETVGATAAQAAADNATEVTRVRYVDSALQVSTTTDAGVNRVEQRDGAGRVVSVTESATGVTTRNAYNYYDSTGRLQASVDFGGAATFYFHDERGNVVMTVDATGNVTELELDALGRTVRTLQYARRATTTGWLTGTGATATVALPALATARPTDWIEAFADATMTSLDAAHLDGTYAAGFRIEGGRLAVQRAEHATSVVPRILSAAMPPISTGVQYSAEISTAAAQTNNYLLFSLHNNAAGNDYRRVGAYISNGKLYDHSMADGLTANKMLGSLQADTTYVVEIYAGEGFIEYRFYPKGQDRDNGFSFRQDVVAAEWGQVRLQINGYMGPGLSGEPVYVDNLRYRQVRQTTQSYDLAGRLASRSDGSATTEYQYDGAHRLVRTSSVTPGEAERSTRQLFDISGRLTGTLDAEGYLTEFLYDAGGRHVRTNRYATPVAEALRADGTVAQMRPLAQAADQYNRYFHDDRGRRIGELDAEGYLTEFVHDDADHEVATRRHAKRLAPGGVKTIEELRIDAATAAPAEPFQETRRAFDSLGRVASELNHEGTLTKFHYDHASRLVRTEAAANFSGEVRNGSQLFDAFGNLVGELDPMMAMVGTTPRLAETLTFAQKLAAIDAVGTRHNYDASGRRIETIDPDGNRTWYFHDAAGRNTFTVRGLDEGGARNARGEVVETRYNAFGDVSDTLAYTGKLAIAGTQTRNDALTALAGLGVTGVDSRRTFLYDSRGLLVQQTDAIGGVSVLRYNGYGELVSTTTPTTVPGGPATSTTSLRSYDRRGQQTGQTDAAGTTYARTTHNVYDAFGRIVSATDGRNIETRFAHDRLGRLLSTSRDAYTGIAAAARVETASTTYDAFSRVLSQTNGVGQVTTYAYNDAARTVVVTTPDGLSATNEHNRFGETFKVTAPGGGTTTYQYDAAGRQVRVTDALGNYSTAEYNNETGLLVATTGGNGAGNRVEYTYDAADRVLTRREDAGTGRLNLVTTFAYDGQGRQVTVVDAAGQTTQTTYDREGRVITVARDPAALNLRTQYEWDAAGRQVKVTEGFGTTAARSIAYAYDALGQRTSETRDPGGLNLTTSFVYDGAGNVTARVDANGVGHAYVYDQSNRLVYAMDTLHGPGDATPTVAVTRHWYDEAGRVVATRRYATPIELTAQQTADLVSLTGATMLQTLDGLAAGLRRDDLDAMQYTVYDAAGKARYTITQSGATKAFVHEQRYDVRGNAHHRIAYANEVTLSASDQTAFLMLGNISATGIGGASVRLDLAAALVASGQTNPRQTYGVIDASGNQRYLVTLNDLGTGTVVERQFDNEGRVVAEIRHAKTVPFNAAADATTTANQLAGVPAPTADQMLVTRYAYDRTGRLRYTIDDAGFVTANVWDAAGRLSETRAYTVAIAPANFAEATITTALTGKANVRTALHAYDKADRLTKTTDALGNFDTYGYDAAGNRTTHTDKLGKVTTFTYDNAGRLKTLKDALNKTETYAYDGLGNRTSVTDKLGKVTTFVYDSRGNLISSKDALNHTESFTYDALGQRRSYTDKVGATWNYEFDQLGRLIEEKAPSNSFFRYTATSGTAMAVVTTRVVTAIAYDAFGNVLSRTENAGAAAAEQRKTTYAYDRLGRQIRTTFPRAWQIDPTTLVLVDTLAAPTLEITYDALGRAVMQKDTTGGYSYKVYDQLGRVLHDIDAEGYVTSFEYDALGRQTKLTRRAGQLAANAPAGRATGGAITDLQWTTAINALGVVGARVVVTTYDALDRKATVKTTSADITYWTSTGVQASGTPTTTFDYDAAGHLVRERVLIEKIGTVESWAETYHYYDAVGQRTHTVDAEKYLTKWTYDANGRETERREYANRIAGTPNLTTPPAAPAAGTAATGYDRIVVSGYDDAGRRTSETVQRFYQNAAGADVLANVVTTFQYDHEGRVISVTEGGMRTENAYDALGRLVSVLEDDRLVLKANWRDLLKIAGNNLDSASLYELVNPYTRMDYDAFGNVVRTYRPGRGINTTTWAVPDSPDHQLSHTRFDYQGRAVVSIDAEGSTTYTQYDAADRATSSWRDLTNGQGTTSRISDNFVYDKLGRQVIHSQVRWTGANTVDASEAVRYNAFGEIVAKGASLSDLSNDAKTIAYVYDAAGNLTGTDADGVATNAEGTLREYRYDLAGRQVAERRDPAVAQVTRMELDKLGRAVKTVLPGFDAANTTATLVRAFDRWGNVLKETDPRGNVTDRTYNDRNQVVSQLAPTVDVLSETNVVTSVRPQTTWRYDAGGRVTAVVDANGRIDRYEYDNVGQQIRSFDALNYQTRYAYDTLGRQVVQEDALRYQSTRSFDRLNRVTGVGDFVLNLAGNARTDEARETYVLNQNGDRIRVTNGESETQRFDYDGRGKLLRSQSATGAVMAWTYDLAGNKISETYAAGTGLATTQTWAYDVYGHLTDHVDLGGHNYDYAYNAVGLRSSESATQMLVNVVNGIAQYQALGRTTTYYANGMVRQVTLQNGEYTLYEYDAAGNRTLEKTYKPGTTDAPGINVETRTVYDAHNRISVVTTDDLARIDGPARVMTVTFAYDAVGNRRKVAVTNGYGPGPTMRDSWYTYDAENRVVIDAGFWDGTQITFTYAYMDFSNQTKFNAYDELGRLKSVTTRQPDFGSWFGPGYYDVVDTTDYNQRSERIRTRTQDPNMLGLQINEAHVYDKAGRMVRTVQYYDGWATARFYTGSTPTDVSLIGIVKQAITYTYDDDGRLTKQTTWGRHGGTSSPPSGQSTRGANWIKPLGATPSAIHYTWDDTNATGLIKLEEVMYSDQFSNTGYDAAGRLNVYRFFRYAPAWQQGVNHDSEAFETYAHTFAMTYVARDGFLEGKTSGTSSNSDYKPSTTESRYDAAGRRHLIEDMTVIRKAPDIKSRRQFVYNADGQILLRKYQYWGDNKWQQGKAEGDMNLGNLWYEYITSAQWSQMGESGREAMYDKRDNTRATYVNGQQIATTNEAGLDLQITANLTGFRSSSMGRGKITVQEGDTLQSLAQRAYGTSTLWYVIAEANGLAADIELPAGVSLTLPEVRTSTNDASTFKPYDPSEITGPTTPNLPYIPKPDEGCGTIGTIIMVVVMIVVTIYTAGAAAALFSTAAPGFATGLAAMAGGGTLMTTGVAMGAAAIGGFVGSAVGQAVGSAMGVASFSWKKAAAAGAAAGLTAGIGGSGVIGDIAGKSKFMQGALTSVSNSLVGQVTDRAFGVPTSFSWKAIAVNAVSAGVTSSISPYIGKGLEKMGAKLTTEMGQTLLDFSTGMAGGLVSAHLSRAVGLTDEINAGGIAANAFATAIGNRIAGKHKASAAEARIAERLGKAREAMKNAQGQLTTRQKLDVIVGDFGEGKEQARATTLDQMAEELDAGKLRPSLQAGDTGIGPVAYRDGVMYMDPAILELRTGGALGMEMLDASLMLALDEEMGHHLDAVARQRAGVGGDTDLDEGALYALSGLRGLFATVAADGSISRTVEVGGTRLTLRTNQEALAYVASEHFTAARIAADVKGPDGSESFDALGHYYTTAIQCLASGDSAERAGRTAFFAQVGDMLAPLDATATMIRKVAALDSGDILASIPAAVLGWATSGGDVQEGVDFASRYLMSAMPASDIAELRRVQVNLHNLLPKGMSIGREHAIARIVLAQGRGMNSKMGDAIAGFAIHKLGDVYAHRGFTLGLGHLAEGHEPDNYFAGIARRNDYVRDLTSMLLATNGRPYDSSSLDRATDRMVRLTSTAGGYRPGDTIWNSRDRDAELADSVQGILKMEARGETMRSIPSAEPWFAWAGSGTTVFGMIPAHREMYTGHRDVAGADRFIWNAFGAFNSMVEDWRAKLPSW